jgi:SPP1 gp7 family putative phage head morphogenesis protein
MAKKSNPKLKNMPRTVNELIADRAIRHALYLERYKTGQVQEIIKILNASTELKLIAQIEKGLRDITATSPRLQRLFKDNGQLIKAEYVAMQIRLQKNLKDLSEAEGSWQFKALQDSVPIALDFVAPAPAVLRALVNKQVVEGVLLKDWFAELSHKTAFRVNQQIQIGMINGEGIEPIVRRIVGTRAAKYSDGILNASRREVRSVVRTAVANVSNSAYEEMAMANSDIIKGDEIIGTLDTDTCLFCQSEDGKVYPLGEGKRPPYHWECRCQAIPVSRSWKELGIDLKELPEGTRASMNGQVAGSTKYNEWIKEQSPEIQDEALGPKRAALLRAGEVNVGDFVNREDRVLTLKELMKKAG